MTDLDNLRLMWHGKRSSNVRLKYFYEMFENNLTEWDQRMLALESGAGPLDKMRLVLQSTDLYELSE